MSSGVVLAIDDSLRFRIEDLASGAVLTTLPITPTGEGPSLIAAAPGGWVVTYTSDSAQVPDQAPTRLAVVSTAGTVTPFGPVFPASSAVTGLAVSSDGSRVAIALLSISAPKPAELLLLGMPGHPAPVRSWVADDPNVNEMISLSWAPDGRRLSYIAGSQTGAGIGGYPSILDTTSNETTAPTTPAWPSPVGQCQPNGATWLGPKGRFAIVLDCVPAGTFREVNATTGVSTGTPITLPDYACLASQLHPSSDGTRVLIGRCERVDLVTDAGVTELDAHLTDAAWAG